MTSLMAWQNRMTLDMLLAEKGVVWTAPGVSITKALGGLALSEQLVEIAGIDYPFCPSLPSL